MKPLSFKITSDHLLLCVFLCLHWGITDSSTSTPDTKPTESSTEAQTTTTTLTTPLTTLSTTQQTPLNAERFKSVGQNETSITLQWSKVDNIFNYVLIHSEEEINVTASAEEGPVTETISGLTSRTRYNFILFAVFDDIRSGGVNITAFTAPLNAEGFKSVGQNETSITLQWSKVDNILNYVLKHSGGEINVTASAEEGTVTETISGLTSGTVYNFTLFTVLEHIRSSGVKTTAFTAPPNAEGFKSVGQNETSITLQWSKVADITNYVLKHSEEEINVTASAEEGTVTETISGLTSRTSYNFILFTVFEDIRSSGVKTTAFTAPPNAEGFKSVGQTETSITLQWSKVDNILSYVLIHSGEEINVTASAEEGTVTETISGLTSRTRYNFTLFTVLEHIRSSGVKTTAFTAPPNAEGFKSVGQTETSITLQWSKVTNITNYVLKHRGEEINVIASAEEGPVTETISGLTSRTGYNFILFMVFDDIRSSGVNIIAFTAPPNAEGFKSVGQTETSITLQWSKVDNILSYVLIHSGEEINVTASAEEGPVTETVSGLTSGTRYNFSLFTVFENVSSSGVKTTAFTVPQDLRSARCEYSHGGYSVYIVWEKPNGVWTEVEVEVNNKNYTVREDEEQRITISGFLPAKTYEVTVTSLSGTVRSKPYVFQCTTDPRGVIAGSLFGVLLFGALVCLAFFILLKRPDIIRRKKPFIGGSKFSNEKSKAISVAKFPDHFTQLSGDENRGFSQEYENLKPVGTEQTRKEALLPENKAKNRFTNVLPYDWCRVKLTTSNPNGSSDYINASYMPGYNSNREYIATQGPLPGTVNDFWRMIWEQRVNGIVMVTNCTEGGRKKCEQYWPADSKPCLYGELSVTMTSEQQEPNWTLREFRLKHSKTSEERRVKHFHFTAWPDHGVPQGTEVLIQFRGLVRQHIEREGSGAPTVVHCSAGVGMTGTIIALDVLLQQLEGERAVGINSFVHKMRLSRPHMVQTESQYVFLHQCIMDSLQPNENTEENIYENVDVIYVNATALQEFHTNA